MGTYLDRILATHRAAAAADRRDPDGLRACATAQPPGRGFHAALCGLESVAVIAEIKRRSPSKGELAPGLVAADLAQAYERGGASALSVLTAREYFAGSAEDLRDARTAVSLPVLRKDFTVAPADVYDARIMGADALLLIVAALSPAELLSLLELARQVGLDALVEVHDEAEAETALAAGATTIGVNQRDLYTFEVDTGRAARVAAALPDGVVRVAESGIRGADDVARLADAGFHAVLVGETLVRSADPARAVSAMRVRLDRART
ncbi:MAG: indole-3-glycerol phosphate synthase TrpC [Acidimicrobiales bacterium]|nr:indole-3-glycerol phosphate synthase TrpC [Acidimicrobiales bacterium]